MNESWKLFFFVCICSIVLCLAQDQQQLTTDNSWLIYAKIDKCKASSTFPSIGSNGIEEFACENAMRKGSGYWSSTGNHQKDSVVTWTGWTTSRRQLKGIEIHWAYAPARVSILASFDGSEEGFRRITDFESCDTGNASFDQKIFFPTAVRTKAIRIEMKDAPHEYIGINFVQLISGNSIIRLKSGITSVYQDMCLVVDESNEVVLDGCIEAIAAMDGRDVWLFTAQGLIMNPVKNSCITLKDNNEEDGGTIFLDDCFAAYNHKDGRGVWELQKNNQLKLLKGGNLCLSQKGSKAGSSDVALNAQASTSHPRLEDTHHGPEMAIDGNPTTYWVSVEFPIGIVPDAVYLDVNLGDKYKLKFIAIDWLYPAMSYVISISKDGKVWSDIVGNMANSLHNTVDNLRSSIAQYVRIAMKKPHPTLAKIKDSTAYGIKSLSVFSNRLKSIVEDCGKAGASKDSRDKFFLEMVSEVDLNAGNQLRLSNAALLNETSTVLSLKANIEEMSPSIVTCLNDKKVTKDNLLTVGERLGNVKKQLSEIEESINLFSTKLTSTKLGYTEDFPAEDCFNLKSRDPTAVSGFYYIQTPCLTSPLRVFCDMTIGASYFVPQDNYITQLNDTLKICANVGMKPFQLHNTAQLSSIYTMLNIMELDFKNPVPIAIDDGNGKYFDLGQELDVTDLILKFQQSNTILGNTAGIGKDGLVFFDGSATDMSYIICSTNTDSLIPGQAFVEISCGTTIKNNPLFNSPIGHHTIVKCPNNCLDVEAPVIGTDIYDEESSVCLAAIHSGAFDKSGLIVVHLVEGLNEFIGSTKNGISSDSRKTLGNHRAFKINQMLFKCPNVTKEKKNTSFKEINVATQFIQISDKQVVTDTKSTDNSVDILEAKTSAAIRNIIMFINKLYSTVDPEFFHSIQGDIDKSVSKVRWTLKVISKLQNELNAQSLELLSKNKNFSTNLQSIASKINRRMYNAQQELTKITSERDSQSVSKSWSINYLKDAEFFDVFEVKTSKTVIGTPNWHIEDFPADLGGGKSVIAQTSSVLPIDSSVAAVGTFLMFRNKRFFDLVFSADVYMKESGSYGFAFRVKDKNMYLLEVRQSHGGYKRLIKIEDGKPIEIVRLDDGGFIAGKWYTVRIHAQQARIRISILEDLQKPLFVTPEPIIDVIDSVFSSGTVGFFTSETSGAYFGNVKIEPLACVRDDKPSSISQAPYCNNFKESFAATFATTWHEIIPEKIENGPAVWKYAENIGGERKVIVQTSSARGVEDAIPSMAILKKHRSCNKGVISFSFFPQCEAGIIGGVFNYKDSHNYNILEFGPSFVRLRSNINGHFTTYTQSANIGYKLSKWNKVKILLNGKQVIAYMGEDLESKPLFNISELPSESGGTAGLSSYNCPGVAFTSITLHPHDNKDPKIFAVGNVPAIMVQSEQSGMEICLKKKHIVERMEFCSSIPEKNRSYRERCNLNFCDSCCEQQFSTSSKARVTCKNHCHEADYISSISKTALQELQDSCSVDNSSKFYESCKKEDKNDIEQCLVQLCDMCCQTAKISDEFEQSYYAKSLLKKECSRRCSTQIYDANYLEEL